MATKHQTHGRTKVSEKNARTINPNFPYLEKVSQGLRHQTQRTQQLQERTRELRTVAKGKVTGLPQCTQ